MQGGRVDYWAERFAGGGTLIERMSPNHRVQETLLRALDRATSRGNLHELPRVAAVPEPGVSAISLSDVKRFDAAPDAGRIATRAALEAQPDLVS
jgi:NTE family protein